MRRKTMTSGLVLAVLSVGLVATSQDDDWDTDGGPSRTATMQGPSLRLTPERASRTFRLTATAQLEADPTPSADLTWRVDVEARAVGEAGSLIAELGPCEPDELVEDAIAEVALPVEDPQTLVVDLQTPAAQCEPFTACATVTCLTLAAEGPDVRLTWSATATAVASYSQDVSLAVEQVAE